MAKIKLGSAAKKVAPLLLPAFLAACGGGMPDLRGQGFNSDFNAAAPQPPEVIPQANDPIGDAIRMAQIEQAVNGVLVSPPEISSGPDFSVVSDADIIIQRVNYTGAEPAGSVLIDDRYNKLYLIEEGGTAIQYPVAMGRDGHTMPDVQYVITHGREWPSWTPTPTMRNAGQTVPGGLDNPLGARALYLAVLHSDGSTEATYYRIHGTNAPESIGTDASSGCVRMRNDHVQNLYDKIDLDDGIPNYARLANGTDLGHFSRITHVEARVIPRPLTPPRNGG